jgi:signal transduction histidine kinase
LKKILFLLLFSFLFALNLSPEEKNYLKTHTITIGITQIPKQIILDKKKPYGFMIDYFNILEKELHTKFKYVKFKTWNDLINAAKKGKIDVVFLAKLTPSRLKYLNFTDVILTQQNKIISNDTSIKSLSNLKRIACVKNSAICEYIKKTYPYLKFFETKSELQALELVNSNTVKATVMEPVRASYYIEKYDLKNVFISAPFGYKYNLRIATIKDKPLINTIFQKAIAQVPKKDLDNLKLKWGYITYEKKIIDKKKLIILGIIISIIIPFTIALFITNKKLKTTQKELEKLNEKLEERIKEEVEKNKKNQMLILQQNRLALMGEMISMIAHQWRQPLNRIAILLETLNLKYNSNKLDQENMSKIYKELKNYIGYLSSTIDDFRNFFAKDEEAREFFIKEAILKTIALINPTFESHNIKIHTDIKNDKIKSYQNALMQALINILNNAKEALKNSPQKDIFIKAYKKEKDAVIEIEDTGGGIDEKIMDKIFDPYFSTKEEKNGSGLGLYISKMLVLKQLKGSILVENTDKGAKFTIIVPDME